MRFRVVAAVVILFLLVILVLNSLGKVSKSDYDVLQGRYDALEQQHDVMQTELRGLREDYNNAEEQIANAYESVNRLNEELAEANREIGSLNDQLDLYKNLGIELYLGVNPPYLKAPQEPVKLLDNPEAAEPTFEQLKTFLLNDKTDTKPYIDDVYTCGNYAEEVHNNAEATGFGCAFVAVVFQDDTPCHALNAFLTRDAGLVYIDCTGVSPSGPSNCDKMVTIKKGQPYTPISIFPDPFWETTWHRMGIVSTVEMYW